MRGAVRHRTQPGIAVTLLADAPGLDDAAQAAGRAPSAIRCLYNVMGVIGEASGDDQLDRQLDGQVSRWVDALTELAVRHGMDTFIFWPFRDAEQQIERFGHEIVSTVRAAVAHERGHQASARSETRVLLQTQPDASNWLQGSQARVTRARAGWHVLPRSMGWPR
jgi:hypothetical protein